MEYRTISVKMSHHCIPFHSFLLQSVKLQYKEKEILTEGLFLTNIKSLVTDVNKLFPPRHFMNVRVEFLRSAQHYPKFLRRVSLSCRAGSVLYALESQPPDTTNKKDTDTHPCTRAAMKEAVGQGRPVQHFLTYQ